MRQRRDTLFSFVLTMKSHEEEVISGPFRCYVLTPPTISVVKLHADRANA